MGICNSSQVYSEYISNIFLGFLRAYVGCAGGGGARGSECRWLWGHG